MDESVTELKTIGDVRTLIKRVEKEVLAHKNEKILQKFQGHLKHIRQAAWYEFIQNLDDLPDSTELMPMTQEFASLMEVWMEGVHFLEMPCNNLCAA